MIAQYAPIIGGVATIIAALIAVIGGGISYRLQRNIDFNQELRNERRRVYADFMRSLVAAIHGHGDDHLRARLEAVQIGSPDVIRALAAYNKYANETGPGKALRDSKEFRRLMSHVLLAMRRDVFSNEKLDAEEYAELLPLT